jgi:hypothetical protein
MSNKMIEDFAQRYGCRINYQQGRNSFHTISGSREYYNKENSIVEIELPRVAFNHMVEMDCHAEEEYQKRREEARIRRQYPAVADAYHKYKMLLELCK